MQCPITISILNHKIYSPPEVHNWVWRSLFRCSLSSGVFPFYFFLLSFFHALFPSFTSFLFPPFHVSFYTKTKTQKAKFVVLNDMLLALPLGLHWISLLVLFWWTVCQNCINWVRYKALIQYLGHMHEYPHIHTHRGVLTWTFQHCS